MPLFVRPVIRNLKSNTSEKLLLLCITTFISYVALLDMHAMEPYIKWFTQKVSLDTVTIIHSMTDILTYFLL